MHSINQDSPHHSESPDTSPPAVTHVAVKALNVEQGDNAQLAEHEGRVLASLSDKDYVPGFHGYYTDPHTQRWHRRAYILTEYAPCSGSHVMLITAAPCLVHVAIWLFTTPGTHTWHITCKHVCCVHIAT